MILSYDMSKHMHICNSCNHRVNVTAHVEDDLFNPGLCINICPFSSVNIKHLFLIVRVFAQVIIVTVHGRYVPGQVSRFHRDVCSVWKIQTQKKKKTHGIKGPLDFFSSAEDLVNAGLLERTVFSQ